MSSDAGYAILAFVGAMIILGIDKYWDRRQAKLEQERLGWAELFKVGSEIKRCIELVMGEPHQITKEIQLYPADQIFVVTRSLYDKIDQGVAELYILSALQQGDELTNSVDGIMESVSGWLKISGLARSRRSVEDEDRKRERGKLEELRQRVDHVEDRLKCIGK